MMKTIRNHKDLIVFQLAFEAALDIHKLTKKFPPEEKYSLTDQIRRSSRSVCSNLAEAYRKRRYPKSFILKLNDCEGEASETEVWLDFSLSFGYIDKEIYTVLYDKYEHIIAIMINMSNNPDQWSL